MIHSDLTARRIIFSLMVFSLPGVPQILQGQVLLTGPRSLPEARKDLRQAVLFGQSLQAQLAGRLAADHPIMLRTAKEVRAAEDALRGLGYTPAILALRDSLEVAEHAAARAIQNQERLPQTARLRAQERDEMRDRYCSIAPPEPYCRQGATYPVFPTDTLQPRTRHAAG